MEEVISKALSSTAHPPPTPPHPPVSKRPSRGVKAPPPPVSQKPSRGATALPPAPPIQVHYPGGGTVLFNIRPGQNDPALQQSSDKQAKNPIPTDLKCPKCGFQAKSYASIKNHISLGCGPSKRMICDTCGNSIAVSNTSHRKKCPNGQKKN